MRSLSKQENNEKVRNKKQILTVNLLVQTITTVESAH